MSLRIRVFVWLLGILSLAVGPPFVRSGFGFARTDRIAGFGQEKPRGFLPVSRLPAWSGRLLSGCETLQGWSVETGGGGSGRLRVWPHGVVGKAVLLDWTLAASADSWVQARLDFNPPVDLSGTDILGISLRGSDSPSKRVSIMLADASGMFYGINLDGINSIQRWMINPSFPFAMFYKFWDQGATLNWKHIDRLFVVVKQPDSDATAASGSLGIDHIQVAKSESWLRQTKYYTITPNSRAAEKAVAYLLSQQQTTGLFTSWKEEELENPPPKAYLYDQALVLLVLTRKGLRSEAERLVDFLVPRQKSDGHWARRWNPKTGEEQDDDQWVGDQAWWIFALRQYANKWSDQDAAAASKRGAAWLAKKVKSSGMVVLSTEGNVDCWWALAVTGYTKEAARIARHLLGRVWDPKRRFWWRGDKDQMIAMDAQTWLSAFSRMPQIQRPELGMAALSFVRRTLAARSDNGKVFGFDGMGPVSVWCEGTAQYVACGGTDAQAYYGQLRSLQRPDGSLPGSTDRWSSTAFGWLTTWSGLSGTVWFYFASTGSPWKELISKK